MRPRIAGTAKLERDRLTTIGEPSQRIGSLELWVHPFADWNANQEVWQKHCADWGDPLKSLADEATDEDGTKLLQFMRNAYEQFEKRAPTLFLGVREADWEQGWESDMWWLECHVPQVIFDALAEDIIADRCRSPTLRTELTPTLVDEWYAPLGVDVNVGILKMGKSGYFARGWVDSLSWGVGSKSQSETVARPSEAEEESDTDILPSTVPRAAASNPSSSAEVAAEVVQLAKGVRRGFGLVFLLIAGLALLRCA